jgi:NADH dehydrogenase (ubiquinone) Fe-S protein 5
LVTTENLQIARAKTIKEEFVKKVQHQAVEGRKIADVLADGVITGVGLIQRDGSTGAGHSKTE